MRQRAAVTPMPAAWCARAVTAPLAPPPTRAVFAFALPQQHHFTTTQNTNRDSKSCTKRHT